MLILFLGRETRSTLRGRSSATLMCSSSLRCSRPRAGRYVVLSHSRDPFLSHMFTRPTCPRYYMWYISHVYLSCIADTLFRFEYFPHSNPFSPYVAPPFFPYDPDLICFLALRVVMELMRGMPLSISQTSLGQVSRASRRRLIRCAPPKSRLGPVSHHLPSASCARSPSATTASQSKAPNTSRAPSPADTRASRHSTSGETVSGALASSLSSERSLVPIASSGMPFFPYVAPPFSHMSQI